MKSLLITLLATTAVALSATPLRFHIGTYSSRGSEGIYRATLDPQSGALSAPELAAKARNANWLTWHPGGKALYAVGQAADAGDGKSGGEVVAYQVAADGSLQAFSRQATGMGTPCHLGVDPGCSMLIAANYGEGAVLTFPLLEQGGIGPLAQTVKHEGRGPHARQQAPHAHGVTFDPLGKAHVFVPDLGIDRIVGYRLLTATARIEAVESATAQSPPGAGPRHLTFHPKGRFAYAVNELDATVTQFEWNPATSSLKPLRTVRSLPEEVTLPNTSAEILVHPTGRFLYVSNRGHDSIAVLTLDDTSGAPTLIQNVPSGGKVPRNFAIDPHGRFLVCANQDSDSIISLKIDPASGRLEATGHSIAVPAPVRILFDPR
ncbi:MAG TPA: lactonase family protein [Luteolibacter sp.]|nr:lactonase family protein [Luteolibacter sp.]